MSPRELERIASWVLTTWPRRSRRRNPIEEIHGFFAERLTDSGKSVALLWLASFALAVGPGWSPVKWLFPMLTSVLVVSLVATIRSPAIEARLVEVGTAVEGAGADLRFRIRNLSDTTIHWCGVGLFRPWDGLASREVLGLVRELGPRSVADVTIRVGCLSRGPTGFPGIGVVRLDPFGLAKARRMEFVPTEFPVAPAALNVVSNGFLFEGASGRAFADAVGIGVDRDRDFLGVRAFREGDRLRDLDHKAWARWNSPVVKEFSSAPRSGIMIRVETACTGLLERAALEPMLRVANAIATDFCRRGWLGALVVDGRHSTIRLDSPREVADVFARIPRCGWRAWPKPVVRTTVNEGKCPIVAIGVSMRAVAGEGAPSETIKRVLVSHKHDAGCSDRVSLVRADSLGSGEVHL